MSLVPATSSSSRTKCLERAGDLGVARALDFLQFLLERLSLIFRQAHAARELLGVDDDPFDSRGNLQRVVLHVLAGSTKDRVQQLFFRRQFGLALGANLADQDVARLDVRSDLDDPVSSRLRKRLLRDVRNVASELLATQLGLANLDVEVFDVDRRVGVVPHQFFADDDRVFVVESVERHEADQHVSTQAPVRR